MKKKYGSPTKVMMNFCAREEFVPPLEGGSAAKQRGRGLGSAPLTRQGRGEKSCPLEHYKKYFGRWLAMSLAGAMFIFGLAFAYDLLAGPSTDLGETLFNEGVLHFQKKDYAKALSAFVQAKSLAESPSLKAWAAYDSGNCTFYEAEKSKKTSEVLALYLQSLSHYQEALAILLSPFLRAGLSMEQLQECYRGNAADLAKLLAKNPRLAREAMKLDQDFLRDIVYNMKVVQEGIQKLSQEKHKKEQEQKDLIDRLKKNIADQANCNRENRNLWQRQKKEGKKEPSESDALSQAQQSNEEETQGVFEEIKTAHKMLPSAPPSLTKAEVHLANALAFQREAKEYLRQGKLAEAFPNQEEALSELQKALQELLRLSAPPQAGSLQQNRPNAAKPEPHTILEEEQKQKLLQEEKKESRRGKTKPW